MQAVFGINFALAVPCEDVMEREFKYNGTYDDIGKVYEFLWWGESGALAPRFTSVEDAKSKLYSTAKDYVDKFKGDKAQCLEATTKYNNENKVAICMAKTLANNNCDISVFKRSGLTSRSNSDNTSNQSASAATSNSPESYNIQVSQNNKQNYQAIQRAYEQANAGKGKKNNKEAVASECMKNNPSQKTFKNNCNQAINFAYCFSGIVPGSKNENPDTLAEMSCQNGQFGTLTIGAGENIPGSYRGIYMQGLACKSPSQPVGMKYDASEAPTGRCSF